MIHVMYIKRERIKNNTMSKIYEIFSSATAILIYQLFTVCWSKYIKVTSCHCQKRTNMYCMYNKCITLSSSGYFNRNQLSTFLEPFLVASRRDKEISRIRDSWGGMRDSGSHKLHTSHSLRTSCRQNMMTNWVPVYMYITYTCLWYTKLYIRYIR